ncbi:amidase [Bordetella bronchiseptica]|uniref:amidase n=1 Tax=Bordetella bronchiseptica TaxID=518 RepID=UPI00049EDDF1|nr:amidase [Bordetella bronchiseptica]KDD88411.1 amidase [Bordetella bronchiseptica MO275]
MDLACPAPHDLAYASAAELARLYRARAVSPLDHARAVLNMVDRWNPVVNAYCHLDRTLTLQQAAASEARWMRDAPLGPADGVTYGIKDILLARGAPTGYGSRAACVAQPATEDAPAAARLREAGGVFVGKTTTSEFGWKGTADNLLTGATRNVWDTRLTSGGSSGGAACAAAAGMGTLQVGTDGGGSTRIPASFCGIAGMKATFGRVPAWPAGPMLTLSNVGPMARNVADLACLQRIIGQPDPRDWHAVPAPRHERAPPASLQGLRIGLHLDRDACDPEVAAVIGQAAERLAAHGARLIDTRLPLDGCDSLIRAHWQAGAAWLAAQIPPQRQALLDPGLQAAAARGRDLPLPDYYRAMIGRQKLGETMAAHLAQFDLVLTPTVPILPFAAGREAPEDAASQDWLDWNPYTYPFNLTRHPAISLPAGFSAAGLPVGLQLAAGLYQDEWLLGVAALVEACLGVAGGVPAGLREGTRQAVRARA